MILKLENLIRSNPSGLKNGNYNYVYHVERLQTGRFIINILTIRTITLNDLLSNNLQIHLVIVITKKYGVLSILYKI